MIEPWQLMHKPFKDVAEHTATLPRAVDRAAQLHREGKFRSAEKAYEEIAKEAVRAANRCAEDAEREEQRARLNVLA